MRFTAVIVSEPASVWKINASTEVAVLPGAIVKEAGSVPLERVVVAAEASIGKTSVQKDTTSAAKNTIPRLFEFEFAGVRCMKKDKQKEDGCSKAPWSSNVLYNTTILKDMHRCP